MLKKTELFKAKSSYFHIEDIIGDCPTKWIKRPNISNQHSNIDIQDHTGLGLLFYEET